VVVLIDVGIARIPHLHPKFHADMGLADPRNEQKAGEENFAQDSM